MDNMLKQALAKRDQCGLPFNFSYRMMEKVRLEAEKKRKKQQWAIISSLTAASLFILGLLVYFIFFYFETDFSGYLDLLSAHMKSIKPSFDFYWFIGVAAIVLLGLDYWLREKLKKGKNHEVSA